MNNLQSVAYRAKKEGLGVKTAQRRRAQLGLGVLINPENPNGGYMVTDAEWQQIRAACEVRGWKSPATKEGL